MKKKTVDMFPLLAIGIVFLLAILLFGPEVARTRAKQAAEAAQQIQETVVEEIQGEPDSNEPEGFDLALVPQYSGDPYIIINDNIPYFTEDQITEESFEYYGDLDNLGRCTVAYGCYGLETVPPSGDERGDISGVTPTGWVQNTYACINDEDDSTPGGCLYNRCHLIAWCISDEDANPNNLITGTRYLNVDGMWEWESQVQDYIYSSNGNHIMYRVTPIFSGTNLLCNGVLMEAYSVEDNGAGLQFCVYCYNVQPGIRIVYTHGGNSYSGQFLDMDARSVEYGK